MSRFKQRKMRKTKIQKHSSPGFLKHKVNLRSWVSIHLIIKSNSLSLIFSLKRIAQKRVPCKRYLSFFMPMIHRETWIFWCWRKELNKVKKKIRNWKLSKLLTLQKKQRLRTYFWTVLKFLNEKASKMKIKDWEMHLYKEAKMDFKKIKIN